MNALQTSKTAVIHTAHVKEGSVVPYKNPVSYEQVAERLAYDADTGIFTWKIDVAKNVKAGTEAGCVKAAREREGKDPVSYRYIRVGHEISAARLAWLLHHKAWPEGKLFFVDGDTLNLRIANIRLGNSLLEKYDRSDPEQRKAYLRDHRATYPKAWKNGQLMATFGITLAQYTEMAVAQNGKCAICDQPETQMRGGKLKALAVDHDHKTGAIRGLLCCDCNQAIGKLKDDRDVLLAAVRYLDKHSGASNVSPLQKQET